MAFHRTSAHSDVVHPLKSALDAALAFTPARATAMAPTFDAEQIKAFAEEEALLGRVTIDERGITPGLSSNVIAPWRGVLVTWYAARNQFDQGVQPKMADLKALDTLNAEIEFLQDKRHGEVAQAEQTWAAKQEHQTIRQRWEEAESVYNAARDAHGRRDASMAAYHWSYWLALLGIGAAEWLINYDTFFLFLGVPAIAAGATLILGLLLAFSAHGHGELLKQWSHRFGPDQKRMNRTSAWRLLALSTFGLIIVLTAAGASRYASALNSMAAQPGPNILGNSATIEVNATRDVLISLLANLGAWVVGVFIAYFCHDSDPEFMDATRQHRNASCRYYRARHDVEDSIQTIKARTGKQMESMELAARSRAAGVASERAMLDQLETQETVILDLVASSLRANAEQYRDALAQLALAARGGVVLNFVSDMTEKVLSPYELRAMAVKIDRSSMRELMR